MNSRTTEASRLAIRKSKTRPIAISRTCESNIRSLRSFRLASINGDGGVTQGRRVRYSQRNCLASSDSIKWSMWPESWSGRSILDLDARLPKVREGRGREDKGSGPPRRYHRLEVIIEVRRAARALECSCQLNGCNLFLIQRPCRPRLDNLRRTFQTACPFAPQVRKRGKRLRTAGAGVGET